VVVPETAQPTGKRINLAALGALKEALSVVYWYRSDFESFVRGCVRHPEVLSRLNFGEPKRVVASQLVTLLSADQGRYLATLLHLMDEVSAFSDFSHLARLEDGKEKADRAWAAVAALKKHYDAHAGLVADKAAIARRREEAQAKAQRREALTEHLDSLRQSYIELLAMSEPQARGYQLQTLLSELFSLFDLDPKASFAIEGEQIDGAFSFENSDYLLEAKWQRDPVEPGDLRDFDGVIKSKLKTTLGLFVAVNGFTEAAVKTHSRVGAGMVLMDGEDLYAILDGRITLPDVLHRKRRFASQTGDIYIRVRDF
jgi:Restriction endonuclease